MSRRSRGGDVGHTGPARRSSPRSLKQLWAKVAGVEIAMLTTVGTDGTLHCRPMATQAIEGEEYLYFFASRDSGKVRALLENPQVGLAYSDPARGLYVMASGRARISEDKQKAAQYWSRAAQGWFPGGPGDASLVLIEVDVDAAQWWEGAESRPLNLE